MYEIIKILGTPTKEQINEMNPKIHISKLPNIAHKLWKDVFKDKTDDQLFIDLVDKLLVYEPNKRLTPYQALNHPFFDDMKKRILNFLMVMLFQNIFSNLKNVKYNMIKKI